MRWTRPDLLRPRADLSQSSTVADATREQELAERLGLLQAALDAVPLGVVVLGPDGSELLSNLAAAGLSDARHDQALVAHLMGQVAEEAGREGTSRATLELRGPVPRMIEVRATRVSDLGYTEPVTVAVMQDVSDRHRLDAVRRDFVANVSHELRTPIGALGALAEALAGEDDPDVIRRLAGRMGAEAERAAGLVADLLDLSRVEGAAQPDTREVTIDRIAAEAVARIQAAAEERGISLECQVRPETGMDGDVGQLVSALANLLDNAVKYSDAGSVVDLEVRVDDTTVVFLVRDQGIGIPARDHQRIFERFYRVDQARSRDTGGTGLGLSIVRHVAINHGGRVTVKSREGEGSEFALEVPRWS
ncbi:MAG: sensor histidine kinase [Acidimicrobiales bacterium]